MWYGGRDQGFHYAYMGHVLSHPRRGGVQRSALLVKGCMFVRHRLRAGICWREEERRNEALGGGKKKDWITGLDSGFPWKAGGTPLMQKRK